MKPTDLMAPLYPNLLTAPPPPTASVGGSVFRLDSKFRRPRVQELTFAAERQVFANTVLLATYIYSKGQHLQQSYDANLPAPTFERRYQSPDGTSFTVPFSAGVIRTAAGVKWGPPTCPLHKMKANVTLFFWNCEGAMHAGSNSALAIRWRKRRIILAAAVEMGRAQRAHLARAHLPINSTSPPIGA